MSKTTQRIIVLLCALALILPFGLMGIGQLTAPKNASHTSAATTTADTRKTVDPATQPQPTHTTAPTPPSGMNEPTKDGALATANYLFAVYAYMIATGDTSQWLALSAPECQECSTFAANSSALHQAGGWIVGGDITLSDQKVTLTTVGAANAASSDGGAATVIGGNADAPYATIDATFTEAAAQMIHDPTREAEKRSGSTGQFTITMRHDGSRWLITSMAIK